MTKAETDRPHDLRTQPTEALRQALATAVHEALVSRDAVAAIAAEGLVDALRGELQRRGLAVALAAPWLVAALQQTA